jgi:hypothetical protein
MKLSADLFARNLANEDNAFFLLPDEQAVLSTRQHVFSIIAPIVIATLLGTGAIFAGFVAASFFRAPPLLALLSGSIVIVSTLTLIAKICIDWFFHLYLVTNRRILEIAYKPFFSQDVNDVLLDQVRCTEIDVKIHGYIHGLWDIGDIIITFDRPTHQQEFILHDIKSPRKIGTLLGELLNTPKYPTYTSQPTWHKERQSDYSFIDELLPIPKQKIQVV